MFNVHIKLDFRAFIQRLPGGQDRLVRDDTERISQLVEEALKKKKPDLPSLSDADAERAIDEIWRLLELPTTDIGVQSYAYRSKLRRLCLKLVLEHDKLPMKLFLFHVRVTDPDASGAGGFSDVFTGSYEGKIVAIKRLRVFVKSSQAQQTKLRRTFCRESLLWRTLSHRHILPLLGITDGAFKRPAMCMVLPWMSRGSLRNYIEDLEAKGALPGSKLIESMDEWMYQIAEGLSYLHKEGVVHGDLHGGNVLVDDDHCVRLTDFGMAVIAEATSYQYASNHGGGALRWTAPELIDPEQLGLKSSRPTFASDIYSFACTCVEFYSRHPPFHDLTERQITTRILRGDRPERPRRFLPVDDIVADAVWNLLTDCWGEHDKRPAADQVARTFCRISLLPHSKEVSGRYRPMPAELKNTLNGLFLASPLSAKNEQDEPVVPAHATYAIVSTFVDKLDFELFSPREVSTWFKGYSGRQSEITATAETLLSRIMTIPWTPHGRGRGRAEEKSGDADSQAPDAPKQDAPPSRRTEQLRPLFLMPTPGSSPIGTEPELPKVEPTARKPSRSPARPPARGKPDGQGAGQKQEKNALNPKARPFTPKRSPVPKARELQL
ncbi:hypothetical protein EIP91_000068 [Steccherinum ochraceum]|uniref:Protein kinase domain-containing protein n=1 Tax=Steccherinum ochraceum TaxID=92696 RepID=A0A4R0RV01_9APHY|nr:hypothetical protein EIP91_000068 [Steccherinum ochraceum]